MIVPELVYNFSALKDVSGGLVEICRRRVDVSDTNENVEGTLFSVPNDKILIVVAANLRAIPGATQTAEIGFLKITENSVDQPVWSLPELDNATADRPLNVNFSGQLWCPPGADFNCQGIFDAGVASNRVIGRMFGLVIPRGNIHEC